MLDGWTASKTIDVGGGGREIYADGFLWVVNNTEDRLDGEIYKIDPRTMKIVATAKHGHGGFPAVGEGAIWLINAEFGQDVTRVDLETLRVTSFRTSTTEDPVPEAVAVAGGAVWVGNNHDGTIVEVDPESLEIRNTIVVSEPGGWGPRGQAATDGQNVWFGISRSGEIVRIDTATARVVSRMRLPIVPHDELPPDFTQAESSPPEALIAVGGELWVHTLDHIYVVDVSTIGKERIVADIQVAPYRDWDSEMTRDDAGDVWTLSYSPTSAVKIDRESRTAAGQVPLESAPDGGRLLVVGDTMYLRSEGHLLKVEHH